MMKNYLKRKLMIVAFLLPISFLMAQNVGVSGTVTDASNGEPLPGVTVLVKGTTNGTITGINGEYELSVPSGSTLVFSSIGYSSQEIAAADAGDVAMRTDVTNLDEVVVTGLATSVKRSNLANSVASISSENLAGITNQSTLDGSLSGKFLGADIRANSGAPGGGISMRLRGVTSIFGDQQPLFIVDGVYVDNSTTSLGNNIVSEAAGGGNPSTNQDDATNRIADIDPEDIESVEILKGASAAAIYGSRAAGGVVIITTKRGKSGKSQTSFSQTIGFRSPTQLLGLRDWDEAEVSAAGGASAVTVFNNGGFRDYEAEIFDHVRVSRTSRLSVSGGDQKTDFFFGLTVKDEPGLVKNTGYAKESVRLNVGHKFNDWIDIYVTNNYINSQTDKGFFNNGNQNRTVGYALAFTYPWQDLSPVNGVYPAAPAGSNVLETVDVTTNREAVNRYIGGITTNVKLLTQDDNQLKLVLQGGVDQYTLRTTSIFPGTISYFRPTTSLGGAAISGSTVNTNYNFTASLVHSYFLDNGLSLTTQAGYFLQSFDKNTVITTATGLNGSQTNLGQSANVGVQQIITPQEDQGFFVQEEVNFQDKLIGTVGVRGDKSTNNGDADKLYYYPKASLAINLHEFDFWGVEVINNFKPRVAYGEAGRFSQFNQRFTLMNPQFIGGNSGLAPGNLLGASDVEPERQSELEIGADIGLLDNKIGLTVNYYNKKISDVLLQAQNEPSSGFTSRVVNGAELENKGIEAAINATVIQNDVITWNSTLRWWKNKSKVTKLDVPAFTTGGFAASLGTYLIKEGESATQIVGTYIAADCDNCDPDGDGFAVYGNAEPDFQLSWFNSISYGNFDLNFLWHWKNGGDAINLTTLLYDLAGTTWDYDDTGLDPSGTLSNGDYRASQAFANPAPLIEDAGYIRLREIGLFYTLPSDLIPQLSQVKVGMSGRNLINIFDYNSYDPEASNFGNNVLANTVEVTPYAASKFINFHLDIKF
ncbi:SusC/RagA family TonB-linked outer membrane protein [Ekhidna sp.]|uniref:SusC/RagA family TonB-linked outer membrane protein n=1 Tax=Ekhidna sp. TaxID=2608089 RepID=UPI0032988A87